MLPARHTTLHTSLRLPQHCLSCCVLVLQTDYDDANVPSLLSIPLLGYPYEEEVYQATRQRILSSKNPLVRSGAPSWAQ